MPLNMSGKWFNPIAYGLDQNEVIDYEQMERLAREHKPKLIIAGASAYSPVSYTHLTLPTILRV